MMVVRSSGVISAMLRTRSLLRLANSPTSSFDLDMIGRAPVAMTTLAMKLAAAPFVMMWEIGFL